MSHTYGRLLGAAAVAGLLAMPPAQAATMIDFEPAALTGTYLPGDTFMQGDYTMTTKFNFGVIDTAAALGFVAPTGNPTQFYFNSNDGVLSLARGDGGLFSLSGFSSAFVPLDPASAQTTVIVAVGLTQTDAVVAAYWAFAPSATSNFPFTVHANPADFALFASVKQVEFKACSIVGNLVCSEPTLNNGQFAIDDIAVAVVPEPASALLLTLGLLGLGLRARRAAH